MFFSAKTFTIFSGGMSNYARRSGETVEKVSNTARDGLNGKLRAGKHNVFDPQIRKEVDGRDYDSKVDGPREREARAKADVYIYQIGSETGATATLAEVLTDVLRHAKSKRKIIVWFSGKHDSSGTPVFRDDFVLDSIGDPLTRLIFEELVKGANRHRTQVLATIASYVGQHVFIAHSEADVEKALRTIGVKF